MGAVEGGEEGGQGGPVVTQMLLDGWTTFFNAVMTDAAFFTEPPPARLENVAVAALFLSSDTNPK